MKLWTRPEQYNPKAREAFGKSLVDIGVGIFKGIVLLFTVAPLTLLLKGAVEGNKGASFADIGVFLSSPAYGAFLVFLCLAFGLAHCFRFIGLEHIHESENCIGSAMPSVRRKLLAVKAGTQRSRANASPRYRD